MMLQTFLPRIFLPAWQAAKPLPLAVPLFHFLQGITFVGMAAQFVTSVHKHCTSTQTRARLSMDRYDASDEVSTASAPNLDSPVG